MSLMIFHEAPKNATSEGVWALHFIKRLDNRIWWAMVTEYPEGWATDNVLIARSQGILQHKREPDSPVSRMLNYRHHPFGRFFEPYEYQQIWDLGDQEYPGSVVEEMRKDFDTWWTTEAI